MGYRGRDIQSLHGATSSRIDLGDRRLSQEMSIKEGEDKVVTSIQVYFTYILMKLCEN